MLEIPYNQARFILRVQNQDFGVENFKSDNFALCEDYSFFIKTKVLVSDNMLLQAAELILFDKEKTLNIHGVIAEITDLYVMLHSPLYVLTQNFNNQAYLDQNIETVTDKILQQHGWVKNHHYEFCLTTKLGPIANATQQGQSDYDFLLYHLTRAGLFFGFVENKLIITDWLGFFSAYKQSLEVVAILDNQAVAKRYKLRDYSELDPYMELIIGEGDYVNYGGNYNDHDFGAKLLQYYQQSETCCSKKLLAQCQCANISPGIQVQIINQTPQVYRVIATQVRGQNNIVKHQMVLLSEGIRYRHQIPSRHLAGLQTGVIHSGGGDYPDIFASRYKLETHYAARIDNLRSVQPGVGRDYGWYFPLQETTEVVYAHINNDVDRPIILGAVANHNNINPVVATNQQQNVLRTWGDNRLLLDDDQSKAEIKLSTKAETNLLHLDATNHKVKLNSRQGVVNFKSKNKQQQSQNNINLSAKKDYLVNIVSDYKTQAKKLQLKVEQDINLRAKQDINFVGLKEFNSRAKSYVHKTDKVMFTAKQQQLKSLDNYQQSNQLKIYGENITIVLGASSISIDLSGAVNIKSPTLNAGAPSILPSLKPAS